MEKELLEDFVIKMNDLQKQINRNYEAEFRNVMNQYDYPNYIYGDKNQKL